MLRIWLPAIASCLVMSCAERAVAPPGPAAGRPPCESVGSPELVTHEAQHLVSPLAVDGDDLVYERGTPLGWGPSSSEVVAVAKHGGAPRHVSNDYAPVGLTTYNGHLILQHDVCSTPMGADCFPVVDQDLRSGQRRTFGPNEDYGGVPLVLDDWIVFANVWSLNLWERATGAPQQVRLPGTGAIRSIVLAGRRVVYLDENRQLGTYDVDSAQAEMLGLAEPAFELIAIRGTVFAAQTNAFVQIYPPNSTAETASHAEGQPWGVAGDERAFYWMSVSGERADEIRIQISPRDGSRSCSIPVPDLIGQPLTLDEEAIYVVLLGGDVLRIPK